MHCVDLGESFPTSIYLQKSASIQPRTSPSKFGGKYSILFTGVLNVYATKGRWVGGVGGCLVAETLDGPFSSVSTPIFASKY